MKKFIFFLMIFFFPILDSSIMPILSVYGFYGSISFVFLICYTIYYGEKNGIILALVLGLIQDLLYIHVIGINMLCNIVVVYCIVQIREILNKEKKLLISILTFLYSCLKGGIVFIIFFLIKQNYNLYSIFFPSIINFIICFLLYKSFYKFFNSKQMKKEWNFKER
ncbi:MAG: rod shape-determining protein MreD [Oscillospiraceae bacterium]|nr:rod shape-determining protein MreD [Oscillospiraceae bacterium]